MSFDLENGSYADIFNEYTDSLTIFHENSPSQTSFPFLPSHVFRGSTRVILKPTKDEQTNWGPG